MTEKEKIIFFIREMSVEVYDREMGKNGREVDVVVESISRTLVSLANAIEAGAHLE